MVRKDRDGDSIGESIPLLPKSKRKTSSAPSEASSSAEGEQRILTNFDQALVHLGSFGWWQLAMVAVLWLPPVGGGVIVLLWSFVGLEPSAFRCAVPECEGPNSTFLSVPPSVYFEDPSDPEFCQKPSISFNTSLLQAISHNKSCSTRDVVGHAPCDVLDPSTRVVYAPFEYESTLVTELDLVCSQQFKVALVGTFYMLGLLLGSLVGSYPADRYGRKVVIFACVAVGGGANLAGAFLHEFWSYLALRTLCGVGEMGMVMVSFTLAVELVGVQQQAFVGNMNQLSFAVGQIICGALAYFIRDWRQLQMAATAFVLPQLLLWFLVPESPRWLIIKRKWRRLNKILQTAQSMNGKRLPPSIFVPKSRMEEMQWREQHQTEISSSKSEISASNVDAPSETLSWRSLFTDRVLRPRFLVMAANWTLVAMVYYGIGMSMTTLGGNIFLNFVLSAAVEIVGYVICILVTDHWGRKPVIATNFFLCGVSCLASGFVPESSPARVPLVLLGKLGSSGAFSTAYVYTAELFPTSVRGTAVGACSTVGRVGSAIAPQLAIFLPQITFQALPLVVFGLSGLLGGFLSLLLPETLGLPLPDTTAEAAEANRNAKTLCQWWGGERLRREVDSNERRIKGTNKGGEAI